MNMNEHVHDHDFNNFLKLVLTDFVIPGDMTTDQRMKRISIPGSALMVPGDMTTDQRMKRISIPGSAVMFSACAGPGKSVSSSDPLSYFGTTKFVRTRHVHEFQQFFEARRKNEISPWFI